MLDIFPNYPITDFLDNDFVKDIKNIKNFKEDKEKNLDFLAKKYYNNVEYWWVIAIYNDIIDPFDFEKEIIRIPDINEVENIYMDYKIQKGLS
jgi:hypothetical protein